MFFFSKNVLKKEYISRWIQKEEEEEGDRRSQGEIEGQRWSP